MNEREKILEERRAFWNNKIRSVLKKYMPDAVVSEVRQCWTPGWDAKLNNGDVVHFDHVSYFNKFDKYVYEYYFIDRKTLRKVIYERR